MISLINNPCRQAAQLLITIFIILLLGKLISFVPVMDQLNVLDTFKAAEIIWFVAKSAALAVFFLFARSLIKVLPDNGASGSFVRSIVEPLAVLIIVIIAQSLCWQLLDPFVSSTGRTVYFSIAVILIVAVAIWLIVSVYKNSLYVVNAAGKIPAALSNWAPSTVTVCDHCHARIEKGTQFCSQCGAKVNEPDRCQSCGVEVSANQKFCHSCGAAVAEKAVDENTED